MPDDRTPTGEDLIHEPPPEKAIPAERDHAKDRADAAGTLADELHSRPAIPAPSAPGKRGENVSDRPGAGAVLDGRS